MTITASAAAGTFWQGLRLVVLDTETPDGTPRRCVSVAAVTCRAATVRSRWQRLVDPGVPIDAFSRRIHHITDEHLGGEPDFPTIAGELLGLLAPHDDETVIIAAHNVGFDISVLRYELQQTDRDLPDVPVLDTMGPLVALAGVELHRPSLNDLLAEFGLVNRAAHDALADAEACAAALLLLLERAAERGHSDRDELLAELGTATTHRIKAGSRAKLRRPAAAHEDLPPDHVEGHREVLGARAGARMLAAWQTAVTECAVLRCGHLTGRVERAEPKPPRLVGPLTDVLDGRLTDSDTASAATVLAALVPLLEHLPPRQGRLGKRNATLAWVDARASLLAALGRCSEDDGCPACRTGEPCPLDLWPDTVAQLALGDPDRYARGFFEMTGKEAGTGAYTSWLGRGVDQRVCDAALWRCVEHWRTVEMFKRAEQVIDLGWATGCRHPDLADAYAGQLAAAGRKASYERAIDVCDEALDVADGSTHPGWGTPTVATQPARRPTATAGRAPIGKVRRGRQPDPRPTAPPDQATQDTPDAVRRCRPHSRSERRTSGHLTSPPRLGPGPRRPQDRCRQQVPITGVATRLV